MSFNCSLLPQLKIWEHTQPTPITLHGLQPTLNSCKNPIFTQYRTLLKKNHAKEAPVTQKLILPKNILHHKFQIP